MILNLEEIERMADTCDAAGPVVNAATVLALVAEVRRCRTLLNSRPALNAGLSEAYHGWTAAVYESEASARISETMQ